MTDQESSLVFWFRAHAKGKKDQFYYNILKELDQGKEAPRWQSGELQAGLRLCKKLVTQYESEKYKKELLEIINEPL